MWSKNRQILEKNPDLFFLRIWKVVLIWTCKSSTPQNLNAHISTPSRLLYKFCTKQVGAIHKLWCRVKVGNFCNLPPVPFFNCRVYLVNRLWCYPPHPLPRQHSFWTTPLYSHTLRFFFNFVSQVSCSKSFPPTKWPRKQKNVAREKFLEETALQLLSRRGLRSPNARLSQH